ncbi:U7 snRNA-associated Sm-like protein LSm11 [Brienomyrus brachyistius]|uniref:U7 snRNA-associated Sm-like protein LSm11 n=1 Tax=Brienomyrus brachyistius TaxID=42636 RepID=UPI0020B38094|nr:U7 snRNA-associated Sm-like protein LSm11 [Brienomyrus brachyistius]
MDVGKVHFKKRTTFIGRVHKYCRVPPSGSLLWRPIEATHSAVAAALASMEEQVRKGQQNQCVKSEKKEATSAEADEDDIKSKLDVSSEHFDPLLALYSPTFSLPYPDVRCFNNVAEYESFLRGGRGRAKPENVEKKKRKAQKGVADPARIERLKKLMVKAAPSEGEESGCSRRPPRKQKAPKNVLTRMQLHSGSPLGELHRCVKDRVRVKVHIRTFKGLRGVCSGFVVAFDKFWNMAMVDVDETYRKPLLGDAVLHAPALTITRLFDRLALQESPELGQSGGAGASPSEAAAQKPVFPRDRQPSTWESGTTEGQGSKSRKEGKRTKVDYQTVHTRHINQLFIRGENVLLVHVPP